MYWSMSLGLAALEFMAFNLSRCTIHQPEKYKQLALEALLEYYHSSALDYFGVPELAPKVQNITEFEALLSFPRLLLHKSNSWGLEFECTWDIEHGTGVLFVDGVVVNTGLAEAAD